MICNQCGNAVEHDVYFCEKCGNQVRKEKVQIDKTQLKGMDLWEENYLFGAVAALLGSAAGVLIFYQWYMFLGTQFLAPVPGLALGLLTAGGYWWQGKRLKAVGTAISTALVLVAGWLANHIFWVLVIYTNGAYERYTYWEIFQNPWTYFDTGYVNLAEYVLGVISIYFGALVGVAVLSAFYKTRVKD